MTGRLGPRDRVAVLLGTLAGEAARRLGRGGGTALPGLVATSVAPGVTRQLARLPDAGSVVVTGTNGKTTTAHLLAGIAVAAGYEPIANRSGSNLERGIVSAYLDAHDDGGEGGTPRLGVIEVDEAALPGLLPVLRPRAALFLNLFRDQLDRYGEVDSVAEGWREMLVGDGSGLTLVLNADDPPIAQLTETGRGEVVTFGIEDRGVAIEGDEHASDARFCECGAAFRYDAVFLGHAGLWRCDGCDRARPAPDVAAHEVHVGDGGSTFTLDVAGERVEVELPFEGLYTVYNALGAAAAAHALGIEGGVIASALADAAPAFGRQEAFQLDGRDVRMWLAKNPAGLNAVLRTLAPPPVTTDDEEPPAGLHLMALLNDGIQDGRDVSWIYDADLELLAGRVESLVASGGRAADLALRCDLAGLQVDVVQPQVGVALARAVQLVPQGGRLDIVATYTAMIEMRELLAEWTGIAPYWSAPPTAGRGRA
ncbi:MAG: MurT ligase domain-containing protein [Chloroflexi bacterium]|nr:MurT ligase domain-containing protein [Chloroflexota bacterium]